MATKVLTGRIPTDLTDQLENLARLTRRSKNFHLVEALRYYLAELADLQIAKDRAENPSEKLISAEEFANEFNLPSPSSLIDKE